MPDHTIRPGYVYEPCDPGGGPRIRVVSYVPGASSADVVDADNGERPRWVLVSSLHASSTTEDGQPRRTGYHLVEKSGKDEKPAVRRGQVWADTDRLYEGRTLRVERTYGGIVLCRILTNTDATQRSLDRKNPHVRDQRDKTVSIALERFETDLRLVEDANDA